MLPIRLRRTISLAKNPGSLVRFTFHWCPRQESHLHCPRFEVGAFAFGLRGRKENAPGRNRTDTEPGLSRPPLHWATRAKWSRRQDLHPHWTRSELVASALGYAGEMVEPRGIAPRSTQCHCVVLLLDDGPEMDARPGLAPGNSVLQTDGSTICLARVVKWGGRRDSHPDRLSSQTETLTLELRPQLLPCWKVDPPAGAAPAWSPLREECIAGLCHGGI